MGGGRGATSCSAKGHHVHICAAGGAKFSALAGKKVSVLIRVNTHMSGDPLNDYCNVGGDKRNDALDCLDELRVGFAFPTLPRVRQPILYCESVKMYKCV